MPKPAIESTRSWSVALALLLACGCAPYRLEVGPQFARDDDQDRFKNRVEAVLTERLKNASESEALPTRVGTGVTDGDRKKAAVTLTQHTANPSDADRREPSRVSLASTANIAEGPDDAGFEGARKPAAPRSALADSKPATSPPARLLPSPGDLASGRLLDQDSAAVHDSPVTELDRELQLLRAEREACRQPREESLTKMTQPETPGATDGNSSGNAAESQRRQLHELLSRFAAEGLKRKTDLTVAGPSPATPPTSGQRLPPGPGTSANSAASPLVSLAIRKPSSPAGAIRTPPGPTATGAEDPLATGKSLYAAGDYDAALKAFRGIDLNRLNEANRGLVRYLTATCLRKQGCWKEAEAEFTAVANSPGDATLADNARWELHTMRWKEKLDDQIAKLRQTPPAPPKSP